MCLKKFVFIQTLVFLCTCICAVAGHNQSDTRQKRKAKRIHEKVFTIDSHTDTPMDLFEGALNITTYNDYKTTHFRVDFPRMKEGGLDAAFFVVFLGQGNRDEESCMQAMKKAEAIIDTVINAMLRNRNLAQLAFSASDGKKITREGRIAVFLGMENGYPVCGEISKISHFYERGIRYITLCHTRNNDICDSSTDSAEYHGLSSFGEEVVKEMNRCGMMIDVSHASDETFYDVLTISKSPVIASHSCARAICDNPRNLDDNMLSALAANGGVIQMCILSEYVKTPSPNPARDSARKAIREKYRGFKDLSKEELKEARKEWYAIDDLFPRELATVQDVCDHIDHIVKVAGIDHVGIGTDFDGGGGVIGCMDVSEMGNITLELVKRGYSGKEIKKIWGGNLMRVMRENMEKRNRNPEQQ